MGRKLISLAVAVLFTAVYLFAPATGAASSDAAPDRKSPYEDSLSAPRVVEFTGRLPAPVSEVWKAFTTAEGLASFLAPAAYVEPHVDGLYEWYICPECPKGQRGLEGHRILAFEPERRLMVSWGTPFMTRAVLGDQHTIAEFTFRPIDAHNSIIRMRQFGIGEGPAWRGAEIYFDARWRDVYQNLWDRFSTGKPVAMETVMQRFLATNDYLHRVIGTLTGEGPPNPTGENP